MPAFMALHPMGRLGRLGRILRIVGGRSREGTS